MKTLDEILTIEREKASKVSQSSPMKSSCQKSCTKEKTGHDKGKKEESEIYN